MSVLLFNSYLLGDITLANRVVMAPMTRSRAINNIPNQLMIEYYLQRSGAGLIITEGTAPSPSGIAYARMPGIYTQAQIEGWRNITDAVHRKGGKIFIQLTHAGRVSHPLNMPHGGKVFAPSAVALTGEIHTDQKGNQPYPVPGVLSALELQKTKHEFVQAARNAIIAGFDGVELQSANGYLLEQFLSPYTNERLDEYGGSVENRCRFVLETTQAVCNAIGKNKTGIRLSPYGIVNGMQLYEQINGTYINLAEKLNKMGLVYIHIADSSDVVDPVISGSIKQIIRQRFGNTIIMCGNLDMDQANIILEKGRADLIAFGRQFVSNPDFIDRLKHGYPTQAYISETFFSIGEKGYIDYPVYSDN